MRSLPGLGTQYGGFFFLPRQGWSPSILSSPLPPRILSPPLSPVIVSSPPLPSMRSACGVPVMASGPLVPLKFAARAAVAANSSTTTVTDPSSALCRSKPPSPLKCRCRTLYVPSAKPTVVGLRALSNRLVPLERRRSNPERLSGQSSGDSEAQRDGHAPRQ